MSTNRGRTATDRQARTVARWQAEQRQEPGWRTDPKTASERQAASLLPDLDADDDKD